jgi:hypothetical protein
MRCPLALCALVAAGCGPAAWLPASNDTGRLRGTGLPAAVYEIPDGEVRIAAAGVRGREGAQELVLQLSVENHSHALYRFTPAEQRLILPGEREALPAPGGPPAVIVGPRSLVVVELAFPVADAKPERFDLEWRLAAATELVAHRTPFERAALGKLAWAPPLIDGWYYAPAYYDTGTQHGFPPTVERESQERPRVQGRHIHVLPARPPIEAPAQSLPPWPSTP